MPTGSCAGPRARAGGWRGLALAGALCAAHAAPPVSAVVPVLTPAEVQRALRLAAAPDAVRTRFHEPYVTAIPGSLVNRLDILTEFRRTVRLAEQARARGDWAIAQGARGTAGQSIDEQVRPWRGRVTVAATLQFDARHTYVTVPNCEVMLGGSPVVASIDRRTTPLSSAPAAGRGPGTTSLLGALVEADFDAGALAAATRVVTVLCDGREAARQSVDFARLD